MVLMCRWASGLVLVAAAALSACQMQPLPAGGGADTGQGGASGASTGASSSSPAQITVPVPVAWGGEVRCTAGSCMMAAVEHENSMVVLHQIEGRKTKPLDRVEVAYHPDSAAWLEDDLFVAAVEASSSLDIFRVKGGKLERLQKIPVGFAPRDVVVAKAERGRYTLLATPYNGTEVAWVMDWSPQDQQAPNVKKVRWCEAPWHPIKLSKAQDARYVRLDVSHLEGSTTDPSAADRGRIRFGPMALNDGEPARIAERLHDVLGRPA